MKHLASLFLLLALVSPLAAAETPAKKKAPVKKEAKAEAPSAKAEATIKTLAPTQKTKLLNILNTGDDKALTDLPGVGETRAASIKKARPLTEIADLLKIDGIGEKTLEDIVAHAKAGYPQPEKKAASETASKPKSKTAPAKKKGA